MKVKKSLTGMRIYFRQSRLKWQIDSILREQEMSQRKEKKEMSVKVLDRQGRWRNKIVAFRVSPEEDEQLEAAVRLSGLTKQDYIIRHLQEKEIVVVGNPRVYKALKNELAKVLEQLERIEAGAGVSRDLLDTIELITNTMQGMKDEKSL